MENRVNRRAFVQRLSVLCGAAPLTRLAPRVRSVRVRRIGFIIGGPPSLIDVFRDAVRALGYIEGQNLSIDLRVASGPDMARHAAALATGDLELVVAAALPFALEIRRASPGMPMVIATCPGMISNGFAKSLEHPGGNVTGMEELAPGVTATRLTLLKTVAPSVSRVALLSTTPGQGGHETQLADAEQAAASLNITVKVYRATSVRELETALASIAGDDMNGLVNFQGGLSLANRQTIVEFAASRHLPAVYQATLFAEAGGLMAWAPNLEEQFRVAAAYVDQILQGSLPGDLPIRHPARYFWTVNQRAAKGLRLALTPAVLVRADRVIS